MTKHSLMKVLHENAIKWWCIIEGVLFVYHISKDGSTKCSLFKLLCNNWDPVLPINIKYNLQTTENCGPVNALWWLRAGIFTAWFPLRISHLSSWATKFYRLRFIAQSSLPDHSHQLPSLSAKLIASYKIDFFSNFSSFFAFISNRLMSY